MNDDGVVSYADIEAITVELKNRDYIDAYGELPASFTGRFYYDVNGDDYVTPTDFLEIAPLITSSTFEHTFEYTEGGSIPDGLLERSTDPLGRVVEYDYYTSEPNKGWLKTVTELMSTVGDVSDDIERIHYTSYDSAGNVTESEDALGIATAYEYDALDRLTKIKVVDPYGSATATPTTTFESFEYDMNSNLTKHTDGEGLVTKTNYDDRNRVVAHVDEAGVRRETDYGPAGQFAERRQDGFLVERRIFDSTGNVVEVRNEADALDSAGAVRDGITGG